MPEPLRTGPGGGTRAARLPSRSSRSLRPQRARPLLVAFLVLALVASACGGGGDEDAAAPTATVVAEPSPTAEPEPTTAPTPTPVPPTPTPVPPTPTPTPEPATLAPGWSPLPGPAAAAGPTRKAPEGGRVGRFVGGSRWNYVGVLGKLWPRERVVEAVARPVRTVEGTAPLTGLPVDDPVRGPAVVVKIDNVPAARPQVGINHADIVVEELVEGGMTRLAAVFHSRRPDSIGPVRSARSTDIGIAASYNTPIFANSGANGIFSRLVARAPLIDRGNQVFGGYWRASGRPAPHNLFTGWRTLLDSIDESDGPPPAQFAYRRSGEELADSARPASTIRLRFERGRSSLTEYEWSERAGGWRRTQAGTPHVDADGRQVTPRNVVVLFVDYVDSGLTDKWGEILYEGVSVGRGDALVFTDGHVVPAIWNRPSLRSVATITDVDGNHVRLTPGTTWIALVAPGGITWQ